MDTDLASAKTTVSKLDAEAVVGSGGSPKGPHTGRTPEQNMKISISRVGHADVQIGRVGKEPPVPFSPTSLCSRSREDRGCSGFISTHKLENHYVTVVWQGMMVVDAVWNP